MRYIFSRLGQSIVAPQKLSGGQFQAQCNILTVIKESRKLLLAAFMFALPIFTVRATIVLPSASVQWTLAGRKKPRLFSRGYVFALPIFTVRATILCRQETCRWHVLGKEKEPSRSLTLLCLRYLFSQLGQLSFAVKKHAGGMF